MGREIKRVPLDFAWPLDKPWAGFINPHYDQHCKECPFCDGEGYSTEGKKIADTWYDLDNFNVKWRYNYNVGRDGKPAKHPPWQIIGISQAWCHDLTQDEVDALIAEERLTDFTHKFTKEGWEEREPKPVVLAAQVNEWSHHGFGHDAINRNICIRARCKRLGIEPYCTTCKGHGTIWDSPENKKRAEEWERQEPPTGEGWQVWETVSEGSPVSPVFVLPEDLVSYLVEEEHYTLPAATAFVKDGGWVPSAVIDGTGMYKTIEAAKFFK